MPTLEDNLEHARKRYAELKARVEARVVRWQWATFTDHSLEPFYFERHRFGRGRPLASPPKDPETGHEQVGFDAVDRVVVQRSYTGLAGRFYETFYEFGETEVDKYHYDYDPQKRPIHVARYRFAGDQLVELEHRYQAGRRRHERFEWEGGRLMRVIVDHAESSHVDELSYDSNGALASIEWVFPNGARTTTYEHVTASLESLLEELEHLCVAAIPEALERSRSQEPICAIALWLDMEAYDHLLPPGLAVAYESERTALLAKHSRADWLNHLWSPPEWRTFDSDDLEYRHPPLLNVAGRANQIIWQKDEFARARRHVDAMARQLNAVNWSARMPVTDDCIVFPVDITCSDGVEGILRVAPSEKRALLAGRGFI